MKWLAMAATTLLIVGCAQNGYKQFYQQVVDVNTLSDVKILESGTEPEVLRTNNLNRDIHILRSKGYIPIGYSSFNGSYENVENAKKQAEQVAALVVLVASEYTNTETKTSALLIPTTSTSQHSGTIYGGNGTGGYTGSSTTYGNTVVPFTASQRRYDQAAVYFIEISKKPRFGLVSNDLTPKLRSELERNTGALVEVVIEGTPAFRANFLPGDVIIEIDGKLIENTDHAIAVMNAVPEAQQNVDFTILRHQEKKSIKVELL